MENKSKWGYMSIVIIQCLIYGFGNPMTKIAYESITPLWTLAVRFTLAFLCVLILFGKRTVPVLRKTPAKSYLPAAVCIAFCYMAGNLSLNYTSATVAGFLMSMGILFVPLCARIIMNVKYRSIYIPIQIAAVIGLYLLCAHGSEFGFGIGEFLAITSSILTGASLVYSQNSLQKLDPLSITTAQLGVTALIAVIFALLFDDMRVLTSVRPDAWLVILYLAFMCSIGGYGLQNTALTRLPAFTVSVLQCSQPIFTAVISAFMLNEHLNIYGIIGGAILIGCMLVQTRIQAAEERQRAAN